MSTKKEKKRKKKQKHKIIKEATINEVPVHEDTTMDVEQNDKDDDNLEQLQQDIPAPSSFSWAATFAKVSSIAPAEGLEEDNEFFTRQQQEEEEGENNNGDSDAGGIAKLAKLIKSCSKNKVKNKNSSDASLEELQNKPAKKEEESNEEMTNEKNDNDENKEEKKARKKRRKKEKEEQNDKDEHGDAKTIKDGKTQKNENANDTAIITPPKKEKKKKKAKKEKKKKDNDTRSNDAKKERKEELKNDVTTKHSDDHEKTKSVTKAKASTDNTLSDVTTSSSTDSNTSLSFPYDVEPDDHCETPPNSYEDIAPLLQKLKSINSNSDITIYDPYYCDGSVISNLSNLGFPNVYNKKEDCYKVWKKMSAGGSNSDGDDVSNYPNYDVLVTNPPYSGDHMEKLINHITSSQFGDKPWFLLLPKFVHKKDYFVKAFYKNKSQQPFYLIPKKRYVYIPPKHFRDKKASDVHKKSSPFVSMWYIWGGTANATRMLADYYFQRSRRYRNITTKNDGNGDNNKNDVFCRCDIARSKSELRDLRRKKG